VLQEFDPRRLHGDTARVAAIMIFGGSVRNQLQDPNFSNGFLWVIVWCVAASAYFALHGRHEWFNQAVELVPGPGENVIELRDYVDAEIPDWLAYLDQNPDVKTYVLSQSQPMETGAREHYEMFGRQERRPLPKKLNPVPPAPPPESLYFLYRSIVIEGFTDR